MPPTPARSGGPLVTATTPAPTSSATMAGASDRVGQAAQTQTSAVRQQSRCARHAGAKGVAEPGEFDERQARDGNGHDQQTFGRRKHGRAADHHQQRQRAQKTCHRRVATRDGFRPPYRRSRFWNSRIPSSRWRARKSGQNVSVTQISA